MTIPRLAQALRTAVKRNDLKRIAAICQAAPHAITSVTPTEKSPLQLAAEAGHAEAFVLQTRHITHVPPFSDNLHAQLIRSKFYGLHELAGDRIAPYSLKHFLANLAPEQRASLSSEADQLCKAGNPLQIKREFDACSTMDEFQHWFTRHKLQKHPEITIYGDPLFSMDLKKGVLPRIPLIHYLLNQKMNPNVRSQPHKPGSYEGTIGHILLVNELYQDFLEFLELTKDLIDYSIKDGEHKTLLHLAVKLRQPNIVRVLLESMQNKMGPEKVAAIINTSDRYGIPLLHIAFILGSKEIVELLIKYGANPEIKDGYDKAIGDLLSSSILDLRADLLLALIHIDSSRDVLADKNQISFANKSGSYIVVEFDNRKFTWSRTGFQELFSSIEKFRREILPQLSSEHPELPHMFTKMLLSMPKKLPLANQSLLDACRSGREEILCAPHLISLFKGYARAPILGPNHAWVMR